jgi:hypothetical protein
MPVHSISPPACGYGIRRSRRPASLEGQGYRIGAEGVHHGGAEDTEKGRLARGRALGRYSKHPTSTNHRRPRASAGLSGEISAATDPSLRSVHCNLSSSCPALCRASTSCGRRKKGVDGRVKPGHDDKWEFASARLQPHFFPRIALRASGDPAREPPRGCSWAPAFAGVTEMSPQFLLLRVLRASVVDPYAIALPSKGEGQREGPA